MMRRSICGPILLLLLLACAAPALAIPGATDRVPAATLLVPFFETGINSTTQPHDTLLVVTNWLLGTTTFHYHVWDIDGNPTALQGNVSLTSLQSWSAAMRDLLNTASPAVRTQLTQGAFYRGFMTLDAVTAPTVLNPQQPDYPFSSSNALEGFIYYTRLSQGSANGLAMVPLEELPATTDTYLSGFYKSSDHREEIDSTARECAQKLATGVACDPAASDGDLDRFHLRVFRSTPLNGSSRGIVFTWHPGTTRGPSIFCDTPANGCASFYTYRQYDESGGIVQDTTIRLDHVVNVIEGVQITGSQAGWISILDVPNAGLDTQVYAFSTNSAFPSGNPNLTWDAIFEGYLVP
jgi:hypothetical protein